MYSLNRPGALGTAPRLDLDAAFRQQVLAIATDWARARVPYRLAWDAVHREYADCSGFIVGIFHEAGRPWPDDVRTAEQLRQACPEVVDWPDVQPGDLLFFVHTYEPSEPPGPDGLVASHVGISRGAGTRRMLDTNHARGHVGDTDIGTVYWRAHLLEARRPPQYAAPPKDDLEEAALMSLEVPRSQTMAPS